MKHLKIIHFFCILVALLATLSSTPAAATTTQAFKCAGSWTIVPGGTPINGGNSGLYAVAAVSTNDIWAVGYNNGQTLIEHWNGTVWQVVPSPLLRGPLEGLAVLSANNVWAVGFGTLVEHWDGSQWSIIPSPNTGNYDNLNSVAAVSATDIWAVGDYHNNSGTLKTLFEHWDGTRWSIVPSPNVGYYNNLLLGISAVSSTDVWAVGGYGSRRVPGGTLIEHWDGSHWRIIHSPGKDGSELIKVTSIDASHAWAVGQSGPYGDSLTERWDGTRWSIVPSQNPGMIINPLDGVSASAPNNVWSVGYYSNLDGNFHTLTEHWNGKAWQFVVSPNVPSDDNWFMGVAMASPHNVWAVGYYTKRDSNTTTPLIEHYC